MKLPTERIKELYRVLTTSPHLFSARVNRDRETMASYLSEHHPAADGQAYTPDHIAQIAAEGPKAQ